MPDLNATYGKIDAPVDRRWARAVLRAQRRSIERLKLELGMVFQSAPDPEAGRKQGARPARVGPP